MFDIFSTENNNFKDFSKLEVGVQYSYFYFHCFWMYPYTLIHGLNKGERVNNRHGETVSIYIKSELS